MDHLRSGDQPDQHGEIPSLLNTKLAGRGGGGHVIPDTLEAKAENCLNLGGGGCSEQDSVSKKKKERK